jgi:hypothetical protein
MPEKKRFPLDKKEFPEDQEPQIVIVYNEDLLHLTLPDRVNQNRRRIVHRY